MNILSMILLAITVGAVVYATKIKKQAGRTNAKRIAQKDFLTLELLKSIESNYEQESEWLHHDELDMMTTFALFTYWEDRQIYPEDSEIRRTFERRFLTDRFRERVLRHLETNDPFWLATYTSEDDEFPPKGTFVPFDYASYESAKAFGEAIESFKARFRVHASR